MLVAASRICLFSSVIFSSKVEAPSCPLSYRSSSAFFCSSRSATLNCCCLILSLKRAILANPSEVILPVSGSFKLSWFNRFIKSLFSSIRVFLLSITRLLSSNGTWIAFCLRVSFVSWSCWTAEFLSCHWLKSSLYFSESALYFFISASISFISLW